MSRSDGKFSDGKFSLPHSLLSGGTQDVVQSSTFWVPISGSADADRLLFGSALDLLLVMAWLTQRLKIRPAAASELVLVLVSLLHAMAACFNPPSEQFQQIYLSH